MEYMALGKPIVQFDLTEGRFSARAASLYAKPNDAVDMARKLVELLDDPQMRASMGRLGRERVENDLAWPYEVPKLLAAYDAVFHRPHATQRRWKALISRRTRSDGATPGGRRADSRSL
jgi:glycosyltransferase involved in cell wall biosynthesis